jgi:hypothetical protein
MPNQPRDLLGLDPDFLRRSVRPASPVSLPRALGAEMRSPDAEALYHEIALQLHKADPKYAELEG